MWQIKPGFAVQVAGTNKLELLKWAREVKHCEWNAMTIAAAALKGNLEMLKYCFSNGCPCDEEESCTSCSWRTPRLSSISFRQSETFAKDGKRSGNTSACGGHLDILKYFVEERKISDAVKLDCVLSTANVWPTRLPQILSRRGESAS